MDNDYIKVLSYYGYYDNVIKRCFAGIKHNTAHVHACTWKLLLRWYTISFAIIVNDYSVLIEKQYHLPAIL